MKTPLPVLFSFPRLNFSPSFLVLLPSAPRWSPRGGAQSCPSSCSELPGAGLFLRLPSLPCSGFPSLDCVFSHRLRWLAQPRPLWGQISSSHVWHGETPASSRKPSWQLPRCRHQDVATQNKHLGCFWRTFVLKQRQVSAARQG